MINNLSTEDTSPPPKMFLITEELFVSHGSTTAIAFHYMNTTIKFGRSLSGKIYEVKKNLRVWIPRDNVPLEIRRRKLFFEIGMSRRKVGFQTVSRRDLLKIFVIISIS
jgi:hypothetical protein